MISRINGCFYYITVRHVIRGKWAHTIGPQEIIADSKTLPQSRINRNISCTVSATICHAQMPVMCSLLGPEIQTTGIWACAVSHVWLPEAAKVNTFEPCVPFLTTHCTTDQNSVMNHYVIFKLTYHPLTLLTIKRNSSERSISLRTAIRALD